MASKGDDEMAAGVAAALAGLPWPKILAAAPGLIAQGTALADRMRTRPPVEQSLQPAPESELPAKLAAAEARIAFVETELAATAKLGADLSTANAGLVAEVDRLRRSLYGALALGAVALVVAVVGALS